MRFLLKMILLPLILVIGILRFSLSGLMKLSCYVVGSLMWIIFGCGIYTVVHRSWSQTFLLALMEAACFLFLFGAGFVLVTLENWSHTLNRKFHS